MRRLIGLIVFILFLGLLHGFSYAEVSGGVNEVCLECHLKVTKKTGTDEIHRPVQEGRCTDCHNPHTSKHSGLLNYSIGKLCFQCHKKKAGFDGPVVHGPVRDGDCLSCHRHHSSGYEALLKKEKSKLCFGCHPKDEIIVRAIVHKPVKEGNCAACHLPHSSGEEKLLVKDKRELCIGCHTGKNAAFMQSHQGYPVVLYDCLSCHSPHSSDRQGLLRANLHKPFAEGNCSVCHNQPTSTDSIELSKSGLALCMECHSDTREEFYKIYSHLTTGKETNICSNCHTPHASDERALLKDKEDRVCYRCHSDTLMHVVTSKIKHPGLERCSDCHTPHGSNNELFLTNGETQCSIEECHSIQRTFTHPIGEEVIDPRSKRPMNCSTCHNPMGAPEEFILRLEKDRELCIQCHQV